MKGSNGLKHNYSTIKCAQRSFGLSTVVINQSFSKERKMSERAIVITFFATIIVFLLLLILFTSIDTITEPLGWQE